MAVLAFAGMLISGVAVAAEGQWVSLWHEAGLPPDSPYWWTVSETVSPPELRATLLDREANAQRYRDAEAGGLTASRNGDPWPGEFEHRYVLYVHGAQTLYLVPLWWAYQTVARTGAGAGYVWDPDRGLREIRGDLLDAGMTEAGVELVVESFRQRDRLLASAEREYTTAREPFDRIQETARWLLGRSVVERAVLLEEHALLARASFRSTRAVEEARAAWERSDPELAVTLATLEDLRARLSAEDWDASRAMMRRVASFLSLKAAEIRVPAIPEHFLLKYRLGPLLAAAALALALNRRLRRRRSEETRPGLDS